MTLVWISRGTLGGGRAVAAELARMLGCPCISREQLAEAATDAGIAVGKLEMAVAKHRRLTADFTAQKDRYGAFVVSALAERLQQGDVVYHGRTGQALLPGVSHVLRVRVISDHADRLKRAMDRLKLSPEKAEQYIASVDDDRRRWGHVLYGIDWTDPGEYDAVINLSRMSVRNAATALLALTQLPEFRPTPASQKRVADLSLAARCRLAIGEDPATRDSNVTVVADGDRIAVTYLPRDRDVAEHVPRILEKVDGVGSVRCTMAATSILWVQERFEPGHPSLDQLVSLASSWGAAIELARFVAAEPEPPPEPPMEAPPSTGSLCPPANGAGSPRPESSEPVQRAAPAAPVGGIIDDDTDTVDPRDADEADDGGLGATVDVLVQAGCAGGAWELRGDTNALVDRVGRTTPYTLAVVGEVGLEKRRAVRQRMARELAAQLTASLRVPVVGTDELERQLRFGPQQWVRMLLTAVIAASALWGVFTHQPLITTMLVREGLVHRAVAVGAVALIVPVFAFVYGTFAQYLLRLLRFQ